MGSSFRVKKVRWRSSHSSFGPGGQDSQATVIVSWGGTPVMWKSGRQTLAPLSTAESELQEGIEGMTMGDSCDVLVMDVHDRVYSKVLKVYNTAAVSLLTENSGSWRTRHLRLRASHLRWRFGRLDWLVEAVPGEEQWADIGTKPLPASRLEELRRMIGLREKATEDEKDAEAEEMTRSEEERKIQKVSFGSQEKMEEALGLIILAISISQGKCQEESDEDEAWMDLVMVCFVVMALIYGMWKLIYGLLKMILKSSRVKKIEDEKEKESEDEQKNKKEKPKEEGLEGRVREALKKSQQQRDELRERMKKGWSSHEETTNASEDLGRGEAPVPSSTWSLEDQRTKGRGPAFITAYGKKWHPLSTCPRISNASGALKPSGWCMLCSKEQRDEVYGKGRGEVVHYRSDCPRLTGGSNQYPQCMVCKDMIQRR